MRRLPKGAVWAVAAGALLALEFPAAAWEFENVVEEIPESNPVARTVVTEGRLQFSFIAPTGWATAADAGRKRILLTPRNEDWTITIQLSTNAAPADANAFKSWLSTNYTDLEIVEQFEAPSGGDPGLGADINYKTGSEVRFTARVAAYKALTGAIFVTVSSSAKDVKALQSVWRDFINSFRVEPPRPPKK